MATEKYRGHTWTVQRIRPGRDHDKRNPFFVTVIGSRLSHRCASLTQARDWARQFIDRMKDKHE